MDWIVATCFNDYQTPQNYRIAYNPGTGDWVVDPGAEWLMGEKSPPVIDPTREGKERRITRRSDPQRWMELLPQVFHGAHATCSIDEVDDLDSLPPLPKDRS